MTIRSIRTIERRSVGIEPLVANPTIVPAPTALIVTAPYAPSGGLMVGTSSSSAELVAGTQTFVMDQFGIGFFPGQYVRMSVEAAPTTQWMEGPVTAYAEPNLTVNCTLIASGAPVGPFTGWNIGVAGVQGQTGPIGPQGPIGLTGQVPEAPTDGQNYVRKSSAWNNADAVYAPITNAHLSGVPTAPTPANADNSTALATTAFVHSVTGSAVTEAPTTGSNYARNNSAWNNIDVLFAAKAPLASPTFTGVPAAPTPATTDNSTTIPTTAYVKNVVAGYAPLAGATFTGGVNGVTAAPGDNSTLFATTAFLHANYAPLSSPALTGTPTAPTPTSTDNTTKVATTAFVQQVALNTAAGYAPINSPALTGTPTAPTPAPGTNNIDIATTQFVAAAIAAAGTGTGLADAPADGYAYGRINSAWGHVIPELGPSNDLATVELTTSLAIPVLAGIKDAASSAAVAIFRIAHKWLSTPDGSGNNSDGACINLVGNSYATYPNSVQLLAGNNAVGYKTAFLNASSGGFTLPNDPVASLDAATKNYVDTKGAFPSGTVLLFYQATAPVGWTQVTTQNDKLLRVVSNTTTGGTSGGSTAFSTYNSTAATGAHTLAATEIPGMASSGTTSVTCYANANNGYFLPMTPNTSWGYTTIAPDSGPYNNYPLVGPGNSITYTNSFQVPGGLNVTVNSNTGGGSHTHPLSRNIAYCDIIMCSKN